MRRPLLLQCETMMRRTPFVVTLGCALAFSLVGCKTRAVADRVASGVEGPSSPAESGQHGADAYNRPPFGADKSKVDAEHQTAGLMPEYTNDRVDATMEGSGNIAWQGSYETQRREKMQAQAQLTAANQAPAQKKGPAAAKAPQARP